MSRRVQDRWIATVLVVACVSGFVLTRDLPEDAAMFPRLVTLAAGVLALILLVGTFVRVGQRARTEETPREQAGNRVERKPLLATMGLVMLYVAGINVLGYFTMTFLFVTSFAYGFSRQRPGMLALVSAGFTGALYLIFDVLFRVPLPPELLGF